MSDNVGGGRCAGAQKLGPQREQPVGWVTETPGRDALVRAVHVSAQTESIPVGTGIAYAFTRQPIAMAAAAAEANRAGNGRITVAVGAGPVPIRAAVGASFDNAARRLAEYIAYVRAALRATGGFSFRGSYYESDLESINSAPGSVCPVFGSGANRRALSAVAAVADGITLHPLVVFEPYLRDVALPAVRSQDNHPELVAWCVTSVHPDRGIALSHARIRLAQYLGTRSFDTVLAGTEWAEIPGAVHAVAGARGWEGAGRLIPEKLVDSLAIACTPDEVPDRLGQARRMLARLGIDEIALQVARANGPDHDMLEEIARLTDAVARTRT